MLPVICSTMWVLSLQLCRNAAWVCSVIPGVTDLPFPACIYVPPGWALSPWGPDNKSGVLWSQPLCHLPQFFFNSNLFDGIAKMLMLIRQPPVILPSCLCHSPRTGIRRWRLRKPLFFLAMASSCFSLVKSVSYVLSHFLLTFPLLSTVIEMF